MWSWVFKNSLAIVREDATVMLMEPSWRCMRGPHLFTQHVNIMYGYSSNISKLPTIGHDHGSGGKWWYVLENNVCNVTTILYIVKIKSPTISPNLPCYIETLICPSLLN
jgi:hypothetical protein